MATPGESIAQLWTRIDGWAQRHLPGLVAELAAPASRAAIGRAEKSLGYALPHDFVASVLVHDGETGDGALL